MVQLTPPVLQAPALSPLAQLPPNMIVAASGSAPTPATVRPAQGYPAIPTVTVAAPSPPKAAVPVPSTAPGTTTNAATTTTTYGVPVPLVHVVAKASASSSSSGTAVAAGPELHLRSTSPTRIAAPTVYTAHIRVPSPPGSASGLGFDARALSPPRRWGSAEMVPPPAAVALAEPVQRPRPPAPEPVAEPDRDPAHPIFSAPPASTPPLYAAAAPNPGPSCWDSLPTVPRVEPFLPRPALWRSREDSASMPTLFDAAEQRKRWQQQNQELLRHMQELEQAKSIVAAQSAQALKKIRQRHQQLHSEMERHDMEHLAQTEQLLEVVVPHEPASSSSSSRQLLQGRQRQQQPQQPQQQQQQQQQQHASQNRLPATERSAPGRGKASDQEDNNSTWNLPSPPGTDLKRGQYTARTPSEPTEMDGFQVDAQLPSPGGGSRPGGYAGTNGGRLSSQASSTENAWSRPVAMAPASPQQTQQQHRPSAPTTTQPMGSTTLSGYSQEQIRSQAQRPWQGTGPPEAFASASLASAAPGGVGGSLEEDVSPGFGGVQPMDSDLTPRDVVPGLSPTSLLPQQSCTPTASGFAGDPNMGPGNSLAASTPPPTASATGQGMEAMSSGQAPSMSEDAASMVPASAVPSAPSQSRAPSVATPPPPSATSRRAPIPPAQERGSAARQTARGSRGNTPPQPPSAPTKTREANRPASSGGARDSASPSDKGNAPASRSRSTPGSAKGESPATSARGSTATATGSSSKRPPAAAAKAAAAAAAGAAEKSSGGSSAARGTASGQSARAAGNGSGTGGAQKTRSSSGGAASSSSAAAPAAATATATATASVASAAAVTATASAESEPMHGLDGESEELQAELEECLDTIQWSASSMGRENVQDLKNLQSPAPIVKAVLESVALVLGQPQTRWDQLKRFISSDGFLSKLQKFNFQQAVTKDIFKKLQARLEDPEFDEEFIKSVCVPVVPLAIWCRAIGVYLSKTKFPGGPEVRPLAGAGTTTTTNTNSQRQYAGPSSGDVPMIFEPDLQQLSPEELRHVRDLTVSRPNVGSITFHGETDCTGLDFASIVRLEAGEVLVYPDSSQKPPVGEGLNKAATVTMFQCYPPNGNKLLQDPRSQEKYKRKIQAMTEEKHARFIDYDCLTGVWQFSVDQF